jgi:hypothetical protein
MLSRILSTPDENKPITHGVSSTLFNPGHLCHMFIKKPMSNQQFETNIDSNSAYLMSVDLRESFQPFSVSKKTAIKMKISTYLDILQFFRDEWPTVQSKCQKTIECMQFMQLPITLTEQMCFSMNGTILYQKWIDDVFLQFIQNSTLPSSKEYIFLQANGVSFFVHPDVMNTMSTDLNQLVETLIKAGFKLEGHC